MKQIVGSREWRVFGNFVPTNVSNEFKSCKYVVNSFLRKVCNSQTTRRHIHDNNRKIQHSSLITLYMTHHIKSITKAFFHEHPHRLCLYWRHRRPSLWLYSSKNVKPYTITCFFITKPTKCTNFTNLSWHETLHISDSSSVHHQEFIHCTLNNGITYVIQVSRQLSSRTRIELQFHPGPARKAV